MTEPTATPTKDTRIPAVVYKNPILVDFCRQYLSVVDEIASYNKEVLAEKDSEWTPGKVLAEARKYASPEKAEDVDPEVKAAYDEWEKLLTETSKARNAVLERTAKKLGITLSATAERNSEQEAPMKERRKIAFDIGSNLNTMANMLNDEKSSTAIIEFLAKSPLPAIGRDQSRTFGSDEKATPKYRVNVVVKDKEGNVKIDAAGFTKAALELPKFYPRGESLKSTDLREAWEKAGNTTDKTIVNPVEFEHNDLIFVITKK